MLLRAIIRSYPELPTTKQANKFVNNQLAWAPAAAVAQQAPAPAAPQQPPAPHVPGSASMSAPDRAPVGQAALPSARTTSRAPALHNSRHQACFGLCCA